jgi:prepilin-type N-terminal cleavage/methylation domain-containing protein
MTRRHKAFTLMELLVVIAIIAVLVGLVAVSLRGVRASATRSKSLSAVRQIALAHGQYTTEHRGRFMPGYIDTVILTSSQAFLNMRAKLPSGDVLSAEDSQSYVWRLAPYVDNAWETFFTDTSDAGARTVFATEYVTGNYGPSGSSTYAGGISERPTYGLNSIFVGGDSMHGGVDIADLNPWTNPQEKIAAVRLSEVKNPARLIVFAPAALAGNGTAYEDAGVGFCELRPPYLDGPDVPSGFWALPQWKVGAHGAVQQTADGQYTAGAGLPIDRSGGDLMPVAHLDGSAVVEQISKLSRDMRRWNPFEVGLRGTQQP